MWTFTYNESPFEVESVHGIMHPEDLPPLSKRVHQRCMENKMKGRKTQEQRQSQ
jgi:hypothetical protein